MRPDLKPEIWIEDTEAEEGALECHLKPNRRVRVYPDNKAALMYVLQFVHFDASYLDHLIEYSEFPRTNIDFSLLNKLIALTKRSRVEPVRGHDREFIYDNGKKKWRLETLGCRAEFGTEDDLARSLGRSRSHVIKHLKRMKQIGIITNSGHGWVDLNADMVWNGNHAHQIAYSDAYPQPGYPKIGPELDLAERIIMTAQIPEQEAYELWEEAIDTLKTKFGRLPLGVDYRVARHFAINEIEREVTEKIVLLNSKEAQQRGAEYVKLTVKRAYD
jgi:hypothetical protein